MAAEPGLHLHPQRRAGSVGFHLVQPKPSPGRAGGGLVVVAMGLDGVS
jgi:hypothetical protein